MGFSNSNTHLNYIRVANGKFVVRAKEGEVGAIKRIVTAGKNEGETVWEHHHDAYTGHIRKISIKDSENYGVQINILVADEDESSVISIPLSGRYATKLVQTINNIDLDSPVQFSPYKFQQRDQQTQKLIADKYIQGWVIRQFDEKIEDSFDIKDIPPLAQVKRKGKIEWDDTERSEELRNRLQQFIDDTYTNADDDEAPKKKKPVPNKAKADDDDGPIDLDEDDIPF
jgi:predicted  nucleic acid-binding Zn-ribbon protein